MPRRRLESVLIGAAGEHLVAAQLCLRGWVPWLPPADHPDVDLLCTNPRKDRQVAIQVKTTYASEYFIPERVDETTHPFVFVHLGPDHAIEYYVVPGKDVARLSEQERQGYLHAHPRASKNQPRMLSLPSIAEFRGRWDVLGLD